MCFLESAKSISGMRLFLAIPSHLHPLTSHILENENIHKMCTLLFFKWYNHADKLIFSVFRDFCWRTPYGKTKLTLSYGNKETYGSFYQHIEAETEWPIFCKQQFQINFREWKYLNFPWYMTGKCSRGFNWQLVSIVSDNSLVPTRRKPCLTLWWSS